MIRTKTVAHTQSPRLKLTLFSSETEPATNRQAETHPYNIIESPGVLDGTAEVQAIKRFAQSTISMTLCEMIKEELADCLFTLSRTAVDTVTGPTSLVLPLWT